MVVEVKWPFSFVLDKRGRDCGWAVVHSRILSPERNQLFADLRREGYRFIGMTSDALFPLEGFGDPLDYAMVCEAWCHCFRDPDAYLPSGSRRALISESDFVNFVQIGAHAERLGESPVTDFLYVGATEPWKREAKNEPLARACVRTLTTELGLRGIVVGTTGMDDLAGIDIVPWMPWPAFLGTLASVRFLLLPNGLDASPRVLTEALCLDVPAVVHRDIIGGWKYVNTFTGVFFGDEHDVCQAVQRCLSQPMSPRAWFRTHFGPYHTGRRLAALLSELDPSFDGEAPLRLSRYVAGQPIPRR